MLQEYYLLITIITFMVITIIILEVFIIPKMKYKYNKIKEAFSRYGVNKKSNITQKEVKAALEQKI